LWPKPQTTGWPTRRSRGSKGLWRHSNVKTIDWRRSLRRYRSPPQEVRDHSGARANDNLTLDIQRRRQFTFVAPNTVGTVRCLLRVSHLERFAKAVWVAR